MTRILDIPIFPLGTVLYPGGRLPLRIFEVRYVDMTKACIGNDEVFGVCLIREGREAGVPAVPFETGCTARIRDWTVPGPGLFHLVAEGEEVFRILERRTEKNGLIRAQVQLLEPVKPMPLPPTAEPLARLLAGIIDKLGAEHFAAPLQLDDAVWVARRLAEILPFEPAAKQHLLEQSSPLQILAQVERLVRAQAA